MKIAATLFKSYRAGKLRFLYLLHPLPITCIY